MVRIMLTVPYWVRSRTPRLVYGLDHQPHGAVGVDVVGTVLGVILDHEDRGFRPKLALADRVDDPPEQLGHCSPRRRAGVNVPGVVPVVWSSPRLITMNRGRVPFFSNSRYSLRKTSASSVSRSRVEPVLRTDVADKARHPPFHLGLPSPVLTRLPYSP